MSRISDIIEKFISELIKNNEGAIEIQRNELANYFNCAPSQINYVLTTRFTFDRGYIIESRRGGGGYIKIMKADIDHNEYLKHVLEKSVGESLNKEGAHQLVLSLSKQGLIDEKTKNIISTAVDDGTLIAVSKPLRDKLRADILKAVIIAALLEY